MEGPAIKVDNVFKDFSLPHEKNTTIKSLFTSFYKPRKTKELHHALKGVSFEVRKGEFFGIVGRNGSGKSTMLKLLAGIYQPTKGDINVKGKLVPFIELGVGFNPELTGRENVYLNGAMMGFSKKETAQMYDDIVAFAELEKFMDQKLKNYSSGMQVRLAFSVAIKAEADILLIDEVLAVGDADFQRKCYQYFKSLKKKNVTVVFVTHDMGAVEEYCDRAILLEDGAVAHRGEASQIAAEYLKLFNKPSEGTTQTGAEDNRWGNGQLSFASVKTNVTNEKVEVILDVKNNSKEKEFSDLIVNIDIRDHEGQLVAGNNFRLKEPLVFERPKREIRVELDNNFGGGGHALDISLTSSDRITIYEHWNGAARFENIVGRSNYFPVMASGKLVVE